MMSITMNIESNLYKPIIDLNNKFLHTPTIEQEVIKDFASYKFYSKGLQESMMMHLKTSGQLHGKTPVGIPTHSLKS